MAGRFLYKHTLGSALKSMKAATEDYRVVFKEMGADIRARPVSSALRVCALAAFGAVCLNAPSERDYIDALSTAEADLIECGAAVKRAAVRHVDERLTLRDQGRLQHLWLGPVSVVLRRDEPVQLRRFDAAYESFPHQITTLRGRFLDIGAVGRWLQLEQSMVDYDVDDQL